MVKFQKMHSPPHPDPLIVGLFIVLDLWEGGTPGLVQASSAHGSVYQNPGFPTRGCAGNQPVYPAVRETLTSTYLESHYVSRKTEYVTVPVLLGPGSCGCPMLVRVTGISRDQVHIARGLPPFFRGPACGGGAHHGAAARGSAAAAGGGRTRRAGERGRGMRSGWQWVAVGFFKCLCEGSVLKQTLRVQEHPEDGRTEVSPYFLKMVFGAKGHPIRMVLDP